MPIQKNTSYVNASMLAPEGMKTIYADKCWSDTSYYIHDEVYSEIDGKKLHLQILLPSISLELQARQNERLGRMGRMPEEPTPNPMYPLIVFAKGASWMNQDVYKPIPMLSYFVHKGYAVAIAEYRSIPGSLWPAQIQDIKAAIRFMKANAQTYGIDKNRVAIMGDSSGGHLSLMAASTMWTDKFDDGRFSEENSDVNCCVSFYGPADLFEINNAPRNEMYQSMPSAVTPEGIIFGGVDLEKRPDLAADISPINYISEEHDYPPFLIMHGDEDGMVPFDQSARMYEKLKACGKRAELYKVCGAGHGIRFYTTELMHIVLRFLNAYI